MKMKATFSLLLPLLMFLGSCTVDGDVEEATLEVSGEEVLVFTKDASEQKIQVTTNQARWRATSNAEWVTTTEEGETLTIAVEKNIVRKERKAQVLISSGAAQRVLTIVQAQAGLEVQCFPNKLTSSQWATDFQIDVMANTNNWTATCDAAWVKVEALPHARMVKVRLLENKLEEERTANIQVKLNDNEEDTFIIPVQQTGKFSYILPFLDFEDGSRYSVKRFEAARKSLLNKEDTGDYSGWIDFYTQSSMFPMVTYTIHGMNAMMHAQIDAVDKTYLQGEHLDVVVARLQAMGFTEIREPKRIMYNPEKRILAEIKPDYKDSTPHILFTYYPKQKGTFKTFDKFPYTFGMSPEEAKKEITLADIETYEKKQGSSFLREIKFPNGFPRFRSYETPKEGVITRRNYFFSEVESGVMTTSVTYYDNFNLAFWDYRSYPVFTEEFIALAAKEGFKYDRLDLIDNRRHVFTNKSNGLEFRIHYHKASNETKEQVKVIMSKMGGHAH